MTHTSDAVPFILYGSNAGSVDGKSAESYDEAAAAATGDVIDEGHRLIVEMFGK